MQVGWVKIGEFRQITGYISTKSSAIAEGPRDASYQLKSCGQRYVSNFYVVDLENFATASRRYAGDIHNSIRGRFGYTPIGQ